VIPADTEYTTLYRIARRTGFLDSDLQDRSTSDIANLIAARDLGMFPSRLRRMSMVEVRKERKRLAQAARASSEEEQE
jgi:hypothetical protein